MLRKNRFVSCGVALGLLTAAGVVIAEPAQPEMQLPPGWSEADMQACIIAGTPGEMQAFLAKGAGVWHGKGEMWMAPGTEPMAVEMTTTLTSIMDGRFTRCEIDANWPGMGPFTGSGVYGYDNTTQTFVASWIDNQSTGIMNGEGKLSADKKTLTWTYHYTCPITRKPTTMREVEIFNSPTSRTMEMYATDPKSGQEYLMARYELTKKS